MNMYKVEIKSMLKSFLVWTIVTAGVLTLFMSMFPSMSDTGMAELFRAKMDAIPEAMRGAFGLSQMIDFSDLLQYYAYCGQFILIAACIYAGILGSNSLIKEESEGTIEFLYAQPIGRNKIVGVKMISTLTLLFLFNLCLFLVTIAFFEGFKPEGYDYMSKLIVIFKGMLLSQMVFWSIGFILSTLIKNVSMATPGVLGIFFSTYMLGMFSAIIKKLEWMKYLSPYHYVRPEDILRNNGSISGEYIIISLVIIAISLVSTFFIYNKKDFRI